MYHDVIRAHLRSAYLLSDEKIEAVLPGFLDTLATHFQALEASISEADPQKISKAGHAMKGAFLNLGLLDLADVAYQIEQHQQLDPQPDPAQLVLQLQKEVNTIISSL